MANKFTSKLKETSIQIPLACFLALLSGYIINKTAPHVPDEVGKLVGLAGAMWIRALKSLIVPLVLIYMISAMQMLKKIPGGGSKIVNYAIIYYVVSTLIAISVAIILSLYMLTPNVKSLDSLPTGPVLTEDIAKPQKPLLDVIIDIIIRVLPENVISVCASNHELIAVIVIGLVIGGCINDTEESPSALMKFVKDLEYIVSKFVTFLIELSPIGIFSLILEPLLESPIEELFGFVALYLATIFAAFFIQLLIVYPVIYVVMIRKNPFSFLRHFIPAITTAMGTSSSAATMPITIQCSHKAGIRKEIYQLLIPLGISLNKDGYGINLPIGVLFMAAGLQVPIGAIEVVLIFITYDSFLSSFTFSGFLATIGASPIPGSSLLMYMMIMSPIGVVMSPMYNFLLATDWLTDRPATILNVVGDTIALAISQKYGMNVDVDPSNVATNDAEEGKIT